MDIDLNDLFTDDIIKLDKKINFIFGRNGTGKSTLTTLIKEQHKNKYDIRIFQGFEGVVGENKILNAVVLGEENNEINRQIKEKLEELKKNKDKLEKEENDKDFEGSLFNKKKAKDIAYQELKDKQEKLDTKLRSIASKIKNDYKKVNYNINYLKEDIKKAQILEESSIEKYEHILKTQVKIVKTINLTNIDLKKISSEVYEIIDTVIEEKQVIERFNISDENIKNEKIKFAKKGLEIHNKGEVCAFCGNEIKDTVFEEVKSYFSADEIKNLQEQIKLKIKLIENEITKIKNIKIEQDDFYDSFKTQVKDLNMDETIRKYESFLDNMKVFLKNKETSLFTTLGSRADFPNENIDEKIEQYNKIVENNNNNDLEKTKKQAEEKLIFNAIAYELKKIDYDNEIIEIDRLQHSYNGKNEEVNKQEKIVSEIQRQIDTIKKEIKELENKTKNEKILAENINKKLSLYVTFKLIYCENENQQGEYKIKCNKTDKERNVTELSTGEKNIIAFLYFIEKLQEIGEVEEIKERVVVFDDPMNSNDDTMQYLIIEELHNIIKKLKLKTIILTHNIHFYLNVKYPYNKKYNEYNFYRLVSGNRTEIKHIKNKKDDFKTSYEALWQELIILKEKDDISEFSLLNTIRRIVETYTNFNNIDKGKFLGKVIGAKKLFDVNSHSIDDVEAELNGQTKAQIINILEECFKQNDAYNHYKKFYNLK